MTDRELLELAAKAAGYFFQWNERLDCLEVWNEGERTTRFWQPHRDDGDALRLAVKLRMDVLQCAGTSSTLAFTMSEGKRYSEEEPWGSDPAAATRRAIVRAAAEIGKAMP